MMLTLFVHACGFAVHLHTVRFAPIFFGLQWCPVHLGAWHSPNRYMFECDDRLWGQKMKTSQRKNVVKLVG